jgi:hypothetical protein
MAVRVFGNTAVVTGSDTEKSMENGKDTSGKYVWTDVFVKQNGKWRAVAGCLTVLGGRGASSSSVLRRVVGFARPVTRSTP